MSTGYLFPDIARSGGQLVLSCMTLSFWWRRTSSLRLDPDAHGCEPSAVPRRYLATPWTTWTKQFLNTAWTCRHTCGVVVIPDGLTTSLRRQLHQQLTTLTIWQLTPELAWDMNAQSLAIFTCNSQYWWTVWDVWMSLMHTNRCDEKSYGRYSETWITWTAGDH